MPLDPERLLRWPIPEVRQDLTKRDTILYALSVGVGQDPMDEAALAFVDERRLLALPSMAVVLGYPGFWLGDPATGVDAVRLVHGEQSVTVHRPLPVEGVVVGRSRVTRLLDRGEGKGAILYSERVIAGEDGTEYATLSQSTFLRGDGGFSGGDPRWGGETPKPHPEPDRAPERRLDLATRPEQALLYRLNGDHNPLHMDPGFAKRAGFERPILHGLCTFGVVCHALVRDLCGGDPARFGEVAARFSSPVFPGETIRTEMWEEAGGAAFRARVVERDKVVVSNGRFRFAA